MATTSRRHSSQPTEADPVVFAGPPTDIKAQLPLHNPGTERLAVRGVLIHRAEAASLATPLGVIVPSGAHISVPVSLTLPPETPPGEHAVEYEIAGERRPAVLRIEPSFGLRLSPPSVLAPVGASPVRIIVQNVGNVAIPLAEVTRGRTRDGGDDRGPDIELSLDQATTVAPGESVRITGSLSVPNDLDPHRRHEAAVPIGVADLTVVVLPRGSDRQPNTAPSTRRVRSSKED
ncbi:MAG: hypothetical protein JWO57_2799 [Pseudonocardiales bacterium]|nr:hypothetical protein [Pseudonocardiales bacterium]